MSAFMYCDMCNGPADAQTIINGNMYSFCSFECYNKLPDVTPKAGVKDPYHRHEYKSYIGFREVYDYCECGDKRFKKD